MKKRRKRHIVFMLALAWPLMLTACGRTDPAEGSAADLSIGENLSVYAQTTSAEESQGDAALSQEQKTFREENFAGIVCRIQECNLDIEKCVQEKYKEYTLVFGPDDFTPQEIASANVFSNCQDGRENQEIQSLYDAAGEQWEYLWYVECDYNGDGEQDYIVLHDCPDKKEGVDIGGGDIWISKDFRLRRKLPETTYLTGGTWQEPQLNMILFAHAYDGLGVANFAVYQDYIKQEMALYSWYNWYGDYERVRALTVVEEVSGTTISQTGFSLPYSDGYDPVRLEIIWNGEEHQGYQVIMADRVRSRLSADRHNCVVWDGNDDGYEDILYYTGTDGGSGGVWDSYDLLCWSEEEQRYEKIELPQCIFIDYQNHKLYSRGQIGAPHQFYEIYGLRDGEYQLEKELELLFGPRDDELTVVYSEYDETVEVTELSGDMDWTEIKSILEEKYPEFTFWREG